MKRIRRVRRLSDRVRETITLARHAGYSIAAVARMMDLPVSTVANAHRTNAASGGPKILGDMPIVHCADMVQKNPRSLR
jgi:hypothetical protein